MISEKNLNGTCKKRKKQAHVVRREGKNVLTEIDIKKEGSPVVFLNHVFYV
jgi:hypothetical protein